MPTLVCEASDLGLDVVAVDLPGGKGIETACALFGRRPSRCPRCEHVLRPSRTPLKLAIRSSMVLPETNIRSAIRHGKETGSDQMIRIGLDVGGTFTGSIIDKGPRRSPPRPANSASCMRSSIEHCHPASSSPSQLRVPERPSQPTTASLVGASEASADDRLAGEAHIACFVLFFHAVRRQMCNTERISVHLARMGSTFRGGLIALRLELVRQASRRIVERGEGVSWASCG